MQFEQVGIGATDADGAVARIIYASLASIGDAVYQEMEGIRASALRHNEPAGVATALLYQSGWFVQWKEGPGAALLRIMDRIAGDPRHHGLRIVHSSRGPRLLEGPWSMAIVQCDESSADMSRRVIALRHEIEDGRRFAPPAVWRRLSTPMRHPGAMQQAEEDAFQRVLVCAAAGVASFELVAWLAAAHREERVQRRFAGAHGLDVASDYVDFVQGGRVMRVIAMARNGLDLPLTRAFLPDYSHLVLLLSGNAERDGALVGRMAQACAALAEPPALLAVAAHAASHAAPFALARRSGLVYLQAVADPGDARAAWQAVQPLLVHWQQAANSGLPVAPRRRAGLR